MGEVGKLDCGGVVGGRAKKAPPSPPPPHRALFNALSIENRVVLSQGLIFFIIGVF